MASKVVECKHCHKSGFVWKEVKPDKWEMGSIVEGVFIRHTCPQYRAYLDSKRAAANAPDIVEQEAVAIRQQRDNDAQVAEDAASIAAELDGIARDYADWIDNNFDAAPAVGALVLYLVKKGVV